MASSATSTQRAGLWPVELHTFRPIDAPPILAVPLSTDLSAEADALPPGTQVQAGDPLCATVDQSTHMPVAPCAGTIATLRIVSLTNGRSAQAIELFVDSDSGKSIESATVELSQTPDDLSKWIDHLRRLGISADRHCCPDLITQLNSASAHTVDTIICTVLDTDAVLRLSATVAAQSAADVVGGVKLLQNIIGARRAFIATEAYAPPLWASALRAEAKTAEVRIMELANDYPQADPTLILFSLTNRRLRPSHLTTEQGVLLVDAAAALAVGLARRGEPMLKVPVAIHDHMRRESHFLSVPIGTPIDYVLAQCHIPDEQIIIRAGDLLRDRRITPDAIIAGTELMIHAAPHELPANPDPCIRSGWCIDICPTRVQPAKILEAAQLDKPSMAISAGIHACIECGLCSHVCPSRLPLLEGIRMMRAAQKG